MSNETSINIQLPLPLDVSSTLMRIIGAAYPHSMIRARDDTRTLSIVIPDGDRPLSPEDVEPETLRGLVVEHHPDADADVTSLGADGIGVATPEYLANICRTVLEASFSQNPEAKNYLETEVFSPTDGKRYVMTFARSAQQTPHALRMIAEEKLTRALDRIAELESELS